MSALAFDWETASCLEFDDAEYRDRWQRLRAETPEECEVALITSPESLRYFCGYRSLITRSRWRPVVLVIPREESRASFLCLPEQEIGIARANTVIDDLCVVLESVRHGHEDPIERLAEELERRGLRQTKIGIEQGFGQRLGMTLSEVEQLRTLIGDGEYVDVAPAIWATRAVKTESEIECLRRACQISCEGVKAGFEQAHAGMTEEELHRIMRLAMTEHGAEDVWLALGSGTKGYGVFNSYPTEKKLQAGDLIWVDGGAYFRGYVCDFIRSAVIGEPNSVQAEWYADALEANRVGVAQVKDGVQCADVFGAVRDYLLSIDRQGAWGLDVLGHGVGLEIHELPSITESTKVRLRTGNVVTIEPSLSPPRHEHGHYIIEEVVAVNEGGCEVLTSAFPPDLWITHG